MLVSAEAADHALIVSGATDASDAVQHAAALAVGFSQDPALLPIADRLLVDGSPKVGEAAALSVLSFGPGPADDVLRAHIHGTDYGPLFVNALARRDAAPYLPLLAEAITRDLRPAV